MGKKKPRRWNRAHEFAKRKPKTTVKMVSDKHVDSSTDKEGHPVYIFGRSGQLRRYLAFTHSPTTDGKENLPLEQNIDSNDKRKCYVRDAHLVARFDDFEKPSVTYSLKTDYDRELIKWLKKKKF